LAGNELILFYYHNILLLPPYYTVIFFTITVGLLPFLPLPFTVVVPQYTVFPITVTLVRHKKRNIHK